MKIKKLITILLLSNSILFSQEKKNFETQYGTYYVFSKIKNPSWNPLGKKWAKKEHIED